ncbi:class I adenylate-forming enzyme family protein [Natrinema versiforme]|uniref:Acyl--CoA ligase n=1 Tax=Natrinema versiforme TaxID=88724 RepID=A0A4P8WHE4_9EURY|nr:class I adenylate-forming enzyme family protein [Natrinema versiforme]QCS42750.1 acyl--CoA ligase [Natrinema versiforme]
MSNFVKELQSVAMEIPGETAVECEEPMTFSQLWSATDSFAGGLQDREITTGDRVAVHTSDPRSFLIAVYGTLRAGCVPVTLPACYENRAVRRVLSETEAKALVTDSSPIMSLLTSSEALRVAVTVDTDTRMGVSLSSLLEDGSMNGSNSRTGIDVVRRPDDAPALIAYVDRDTAPPVDRGDEAPLAVVYTHATLTAAATAGASLRPEGADGADGDLESHCSGLQLSNPIEFMYGANATLTDGGRYHPIAEPDSEAIRSLIVTADIDRTFLTPQQYRDLRASDLSTEEYDLTVVESTPTAIGGQSGDTGDADRLFGLPETGLTHRRTPDDLESGTIGTPLSDVRARVLERADGDELAVAGPALMDGYFERSSLTDEMTETLDEAHWIATGVPVQSRNDEIVLATESDAARAASTR